MVRTLGTKGSKKISKIKKPFSKEKFNKIKRLFDESLGRFQDSGSNPNPRFNPHRFGNSPLNIGNNPPTFGDNPLSVVNNPPSVGKNPHSGGNNPPIVGNISVIIGNNPSNLANMAAKLEKQRFPYPPTKVKLTLILMYKNLTMCAQPTRKTWMQSNFN